MPVRQIILGLQRRMQKCPGPDEFTRFLDFFCIANWFWIALSENFGRGNKRRMFHHGRTIRCTETLRWNKCADSNGIVAPCCVYGNMKARWFSWCCMQELTTDLATMALWWRAWVTKWKLLVYIWTLPRPKFWQLKIWTNQYSLILVVIWLKYYMGKIRNI